MEEKIKRARSYVLWLLARKDYSRRQLEEKLKKRELSVLEIKDLLESLIENGWYQEGTFKKVRTRQLIKRGYGPSMIKAKLGQEKVQVSKEDITQAYEDLGTSAGQEVRALIHKFLKRYTGQGHEGRELQNRVVQALARKGFSFDVAIREYKNFSDG